MLPLKRPEARLTLRLWGFWASLAEPAAAVAGILLTSLLTAAGGVVLPILLSIAAGAMIFITVEELIPESRGGPWPRRHLRLPAGFLADGAAGNPGRLTAPPEDAES